MASDASAETTTQRAIAPPWLLGLIGVVTIIVAYVRLRHGDFLWDDDAHITANPTIIGPLGLKEIWTSGKANYFPLTMTSFWIQHALWGLNPFPYHVVTLLFHVAATFLLWRTLVRLQVPGAWLGAMLWALHPVQVESVGWICELKNTQSGFFYLLAIYFFIRWLQRADAPRVAREYSFALVAAILAILSKSSTVMLPVVLGLIGWWMGKRRWRDAIWLLPFVAVSLIASGWTIWEQKVNSMASGPEWDNGLASRFMIAGKVPWFYLGKLLWPEPLIFIYPRWNVNDLGFVHWLPLVATIAVVGILWRARDGKLRPLFLGFMIFGVSLFPVLGFFDVFFFRYSFVGDHFQYLASMGPLVLVGVGVVTLANRFESHRIRVEAIASAVLLAMLTLLTWRQTAIYLNREALWSDTVRLNPRAWIAQENLGSEYMTTGRPALAIPHFQAALGLKPDDAITEANWGSALIQLGQNTEALGHLEKAVQLMPKLAEAHNSLAVALTGLGRNAEAIEHLETTLRLQPGFIGALVNLSGAFIHAGRANEAVPRLAEAIKAQPLSGDLHRAMANVLVAAGRSTEALEDYGIAVRLNPRDLESLTALVDLLAQRGAYPQALEYAAAALRLQPNSPDLRYKAGNVLLMTGHAEEAVREYQEALRLRPDFLDARANLGGALYRLRRGAEALPQYQAVVAAQPKQAAARNNLAGALMMVGSVPEAIQQYREAVRLQPDYLEARCNLALALEAAGQKAEAIHEYEEVLRQKPDHPIAQAQLKRLRIP